MNALLTTPAIDEDGQVYFSGTIICLRGDERFSLDGRKLMHATMPITREHQNIVWSEYLQRNVKQTVFMTSILGHVPWTLGQFPMIPRASEIKSGDIKPCDDIAKFVPPLLLDGDITPRNLTVADQP
jgi:hypothetical protein